MSLWRLKLWWVSSELFALFSWKSLLPSTTQAGECISGKAVLFQIFPDWIFRRGWGSCSTAWHWGRECWGATRRTTRMCLGTCLRRGLSSWEEKFITHRLRALCCLPKQWVLARSGEEPVRRLCSTCVALISVSLIASVATWHGEEEQSPSERDFFPTGAGRESGMGWWWWPQAWLCYVETCWAKPLWTRGQAHALSHGEREFCGCVNSKQRLMLYKASVVRMAFGLFLLCNTIKWCKYQQNASLCFV